MKQRMEPHMLVAVAGQMTGADEVSNVLEVARTQHYGGGAWSRRFERDLGHWQNRRWVSLCNSGSSALLLAVLALELPRGSKVATCAVNFPTTLAAIYHAGLTPVIVDADTQTLNIDESKLARVLDEHDDIRAVLVAHTLGNPVRIPETTLPVIEDCCDAMGATIDGQLVGTLGDMATFSFYPAHHMTMGEGGAIVFKTAQLKKVADSYRDWGRDCWCGPGEDNTCGTRFSGEYDHKYTYSRIGYNLKSSDMQAAVGVAQLRKLNGFIEARKRNWMYLRDRLSRRKELQFVSPTPGAIMSPFGFAFLTERRNELSAYLDAHGIGTRPIMGGNLLRQPAFKDAPREIATALDGADQIHDHGMYVGCWPGLDQIQLDHIVWRIDDFYG